MLLQHPWLASLSKPETITEADEEEDGAGMDMASHGTEDPEVAEWVKNALDRKKKGLMGESQKPALHAAPLDTMSPMSSPG
jgi:mitogen-activated protein kinase kinase